MVSAFPHDGNPPGISVINRFNRHEPFTIHNTGTATLYVQTERSTGDYPTGLSLSYSRDGVSWEDFNIYNSGAYVSTTVVEVEPGGKCMFAGNNRALGGMYYKNNAGSEFYTSFAPYGSTYCVSGNILSLLYGNTGAVRFNEEELTSNDYPFSYLFNASDLLQNVPYLGHIENTVPRCYKGLLRGCTGIVEGCEIGALSIASYACYKMYEGCSGLRTAPSLGGISSVGSYGFNDMFKDSGIEEVPRLPRIASNAYAYIHMFSGCPNLRDVSHVDLSKHECYSSAYDYMFEHSGVTSLPIMPPDGSGFSFYGMFSDCINLESAHLNVKTTGNYVWNRLFKGCSSLSLLEVDFKTWPTSTPEWMAGVSETGTFICPNELEIPSPRGASSVPGSWTIITK